MADCSEVRFSKGPAWTANASDDRRKTGTAAAANAARFNKSRREMKVMGSYLRS
jgi:hypothetical protein